MDFVLDAGIGAGRARNATKLRVANQRACALGGWCIRADVGAGVQNIADAGFLSGLAQRIGRNVGTAAGSGPAAAAAQKQHAKSHREARQKTSE